MSEDNTSRQYVKVELHAGMSPSSKELKYKLFFYLALLVLLALIVFGAVEYSFHGMAREAVLVVKTTETAAYDLFDKQFSHLLTVLSVLFATFGLAIPCVTFFFQRETLKDERNRMMEDVAAHEKQLLERIEALKAEVDNSSGALRRELSSKVSEVDTSLQSFKTAKDNFEMELSYRLGRDFFISGNAFSDNHIAQMMLWFYALEQFARHPGHKGSMSWIDSTLANIFAATQDKKKLSYFAIRSQDRLEALKILKSIAENEKISPYLRENAHDMALTILQLPEPILDLAPPNDSSSSPNSNDSPRNTAR